MENNMKSFKHYLTESKKIYEFKVKIAGDLPQGFDKQLKACLSQFNVESCSKATRTPIQESPIDFPQAKFKEISVFNVCLSYPTTSPIVKQAIAQMLQIDESLVLVRTNSEDAEAVMNAEGMKMPGDGEALLDKDYEASNNQDIVGDKHTLSFLKGLAKTKHELEEVKGVNPELFPKAKKGQKQ